MYGFTLVLCFVVCGCERESTRGAWLPDDESARVATIERQFRGFDVAMAETGYRYRELFFAGQDGNWEYARYQSEKIRAVVERGVERRPRRAASANMLYPALERVDAAARSGSRDAFDEAFVRLTETCNACHRAETMGFVVVRAPDVRAVVTSGP